MRLLLDRHWLLTSTTYGTWLPGGRRGFVGPVDDADGSYVTHNTAGSPYDADMPGLQRWSEGQLRGEPIYLVRRQAAQVIEQFQETASYRGWNLLVASVMNNHFHALLSVHGDPEPDSLLRDMKAYASRRLNKHWGKPESGTWWTESGSKRRKKTEAEVRRSTAYVWNQHQWLARWAHSDLPEDWLASGERQLPG